MSALCRRASAKLRHTGVSAPQSHACRTDTSRHFYCFPPAHQVRRPLEASRRPCDAACLRHYHPGSPFIYQTNADTIIAGDISPNGYNACSGIHIRRSATDVPVQPDRNTCPAGTIRRAASDATFRRNPFPFFIMPLSGRLRPQLPRSLSFGQRWGMFSARQHNVFPIPIGGAFNRKAPEKHDTYFSGAFTS